MDIHKLTPTERIFCKDRIIDSKSSRKITDFVRMTTSGIYYTSVPKFVTCIDCKVIDRAIPVRT